MNEQTKYMYIYRHDGGDYIGCRIQGLNCDCQYDSEEEVDCENCKWATWKEQFANRRDR